MRQQTPTYGEKNAGIIGTFLGAIFGVLLSGCLLASGSSILFTLWTMKTTTDPAEIQQMMAEVIHIDLPDNLRPSQGIQVLKSQTVLSFRDGDDDQVPTTKLQIVRARKPLTYNQQQLENLLLKKSDFPIFLELDEPTSETMVWTIDDNPTEVVHETYNARPKSEYKILREPDTKITVHRYHVISIDEDGATGISIVLEKPQSEMTPKEIRQLFESLKTLDPAS